jgi:hypothetical protein
MKRLLAAAAIAAAMTPPPVASAPKAEHPAECGWYWDIAITARAQAMEGVERETTRRAIWRVFVTKEERVREIGNAVIDAVFSTPWAETEHAGELAKKIQDACMESGDMDSVLGTSL